MSKRIQILDAEIVALQKSKHAIEDLIIKLENEVQHEILKEDDKEWE